MGTGWLLLLDSRIGRFGRGNRRQTGETDRLLLGQAHVDPETRHPDGLEGGEGEASLVLEALDAPAEGQRLAEPGEVLDLALLLARRRAARQDRKVDRLPGAELEVVAAVAHAAHEVRLVRDAQDRARHGLEQDRPGRVER